MMSMAPALNCGAGFGTIVVLSHGFVHLTSHIRPAVIPSHTVTHKTLSRETRKRRRMWQVDKVTSHWQRDKLLYSSIDWGASNKHCFFVLFKICQSLNEFYSGLLKQFIFGLGGDKSSKAGGVVKIPLVSVTDCASVLVCTSTAKMVVVISSIFLPLAITGSKILSSSRV